VAIAVAVVAVTTLRFSNFAFQTQAPSAGNKPAAEKEQAEQRRKQAEEERRGEAQQRLAAQEAEQVARRKAEQQQAEQQRREEERLAEARRQAEGEATRKAEQQQAEQRRREEERLAEVRRQAEAEATHKAEQQAKGGAEQRRKEEDAIPKAARRQVERKERAHVSERRHLERAQKEVRKPADTTHARQCPQHASERTVARRKKERAVVARHLRAERRSPAREPPRGLHPLKGRAHQAACTGRP
jgi:hypothetical protein